MTKREKKDKKKRDRQDRCICPPGTASMHLRACPAKAEQRDAYMKVLIEQRNRARNNELVAEDKADRMTVAIQHLIGTLEQSLKSLRAHFSEYLPTDDDLERVGDEDNHLY